MKKPVLFLGIAALATALGACSKDHSLEKLPEGMITRNDFENVQGWGAANEPSVTTEKAHSGKYSVVTNSQIEFGYTYVRQMGQMTGGKPKKLTITAWAWVPDKDASAAVVVDVKHSPEKGNQVFYAGLDLAHTVTKFKEWEQVSKTFVLPDSIASANVCKVYMWRGSSPRAVYLDDVSIQVEN